MNFLNYNGKKKTARCLAGDPDNIKAQKTFAKILLREIVKDPDDMPPYS